METSNIKVYSDTDPEVNTFLEKIPKYAQQAKAMNLPYWIFVQNSNPIGIVVVGKEPIQLISETDYRLLSGKKF